jgi:hypothetical protein
MLNRAGIVYDVEDKGKFVPAHIDTKLVEVPAHVETSWDETTKMASVKSVPYDVKRESTTLKEEYYDQGFTLRIEAKDGAKNDGYVGFYTQFIFDKDGKLLETGIWE